MKKKLYLGLTLALLIVGFNELIYQMIILFQEISNALIPRLTGVQS